MPLKNDHQAGKTYLSIFNGAFALSVEEGTEGAITRTNKNGKITHELHFNTLDGVLIRNIVKDTTGTFGVRWIVSLQESDALYELSLPYSGRVTGGLFLRLPNIEIDQPVTLKLYQFTEDDVTKNVLVVYQHGVKIEQKWSRENPGDLPKMEQVMVKGTLVWDDTKQFQFLETMIEEYREYFNSLPAYVPVSKPQPKPTVTNHTPKATEPPAEEIHATTPAANIKDDPMKAEYLEACNSGFPGSLDEYKDYKTRTAEVKQQVQTAKPVTAKPPSPGSKAALANSVNSDANFGGLKGATIMDPLQIGFADVKNHGFAGTIQEFKAWCEENGCEYNDCMFTPEGLAISSLPF